MVTLQKILLLGFAKKQKFVNENLRKSPVGIANAVKEVCAMKVKVYFMADNGVEHRY